MGLFLGKIMSSWEIYLKYIPLKFIRLIKDSTRSLVCQYLFSLQTDSQAPKFLFLIYFFICGVACCQQLNKNPFHVNATFVALPAAVRYKLAKQQQSAALWLCTCLFGFGCCCSCFLLTIKITWHELVGRFGFVFCTFSMGRALFWFLPVSRFEFSIWRRRH